MYWREYETLFIPKRIQLDNANIIKVSDLVLGPQDFKSQTGRVGNLLFVGPVLPMESCNYHQLRFEHFRTRPVFVENYGYRCNNFEFKDSTDAFKEDLELAINLSKIHHKAFAQIHEVCYGNQEFINIYAVMSPLTYNIQLNPLLAIKMFYCAVVSMYVLSQNGYSLTEIHPSYFGFDSNNNPHLITYFFEPIWKYQINCTNTSTPYFTENHPSVLIVIFHIVLSDSRFPMFELYKSLENGCLTQELMERVDKRYVSFYENIQKLNDPIEILNYLNTHSDWIFPDVDIRLLVRYIDELMPENT